MFYAGIDIGSTMTKVVLLDRDDKLISIVKGPTGPEHRQLAHEVMSVALEQAGLNLEDIDYIVATGYGRLNVPFADRQITELTCHAAGLYFLFPQVKTAIDIGGQDAKCMKIKNGRLQTFLMNDKCAAGTGRFLEILAATLGVRLEDMGDLAFRSTQKIQISNLCTIFAQQEVVAALSEGASLEDILAGLAQALAGRVASLARRLRVEPEVVLTGGVAKNEAIVRAMAENLGCEVRVPEDPLITGALGAALMAAKISTTEQQEDLAAKSVRRLAQATFFNSDMR
ncbi:MAG: acyl-CoA dehydratase activase [Pseudomonadota bacterium]